MEYENMRPSRLFYILGVFVLFAGITIFTMYVIDIVKYTGNGTMQFIVPGTYEMNLDKPGKYTIFHEYRSYFNGKIFSNNRSIPGLSCTVVRKEDNSAVNLSSPSGTYTYSINGREGIAVLDFTIENPGIYELKATYENGFQGRQTVLAVGQGLIKKIFTEILTAVVILLGSISGAVLIFLFTYYKRSKKSY